MKVQKSALACAAALAAAAPAVAGTTTWTEVGDAGQTIGDSQLIGGPPGILTTINGSLGISDVDLYEICVDNFQDFSVVASSTVGNESPMLFLFDQIGNGVKFSASSNPFEASWFDNLLLNSNGHYFLGVASRDATAIDDDGQALWNQNTGSQFAPNGPGGNEALDDWNFSGGSAQGAYTVELRGTDFFPIPGTPTPGSLPLLCLAAICTKRRRRS